MDTFTLTFTFQRPTTTTRTQKVFQLQEQQKDQLEQLPQLQNLQQSSGQGGEGYGLWQPTEQEEEEVKKTLTTQQDNNRTKPNFLPTIWNEKRAVTHSKMAQILKQEQEQQQNPSAWEEYHKLWYNK